ncbi:hypothetical protein ACS0TY_032109 [Phlomoides rotata]
MGKRKSRAKPEQKKRDDKLDTVFSCPFCNHGTSVECRLDMKNMTGEANCRICQESFSMPITALSEPIDIYSEWIDECERVNTVEDDDEGGSWKNSYKRRRGEEEEEDDDGVGGGGSWKSSFKNRNVEEDEEEEEEDDV